MNLNYDEYAREGKKLVDWKNLEAEPLSQGEYVAAHKGLVIPCHDVFIRYTDREDGILLVRRKGLPARNVLWPIGGRLKRGVPAETSLREKAHEECGLALEDLRLIGVDRTVFRTDPFGHGRGTDTINLVYFAKGRGRIKLNELHDRPRLVNREDYLSLRGRLHPYVVEYMDLLWSGKGSPSVEQVLNHEWGIQS